MRNIRIQFFGKTIDDVSKYIDMYGYLIESYSIVGKGLQMINPFKIKEGAFCRLVAFAEVSNMQLCMLANSVDIDISVIVDLDKKKVLYRAKA